MASAHDQPAMSEYESLMWTLDANPRLSSTIANLSILDRAPDVDELTRRLEDAVGAIGRLGQRVVESPFRVTAPRWEKVADLDIRDHLRIVHLRRASYRRLLDAAMEAFAVPFDRAQPLWEFVIFDGMRDGRAAMLQRIHHTITDGEGGLRVSLQFVDLERDATMSAARALATTRDGPAGDRKRGAEAPTELPSAFSTPWSALLSGVRHLADPRMLVDDARQAAALSTSAFRQIPLGPRHLSPLWSTRSAERRLDTLDVPLEAVRDAARSLGGTVNDVFATAVAGAAGAYHRRHGVDIAELRMAMPVSTRGADRSASNQFTPTQLLVPTAEMEPVDRFVAIHELLAAARQEVGSGAIDSIAGLVNLLPGAVVSRFGTWTAESIDFVISNIRASPTRLYFAGARIDANYPIGPLAATACNVTVMSYDGTLSCGIVTDTAAVQDPVGFRSDLRRSFKELLAAASR